MKKLLFAFLFVLFGLGALHGAHSAYADSANKVPVEVFERLDCQHCRDEKEFFVELNLKRDDFQVRFHDIGESEHYEHWRQIADLENLPKVTPITLVGNVIIQGFDSADTTGQRIEELIDKSIGKDTLNFEEFVAAGGSGKVESIANGTCDAEEGVCGIEEEQMLVTLPIFGVVNLKQFSLPALSLILGFVDGFNPCAMWVLVTFLIVLVEVGSKRRMWQIAGLFILAEAIMYYLILNVWFTAWDFVGLDHIVTPIVGLVAIGGGIFFLHEWKTSDGTCKITNAQQKSKTHHKIRGLVNAELTILTILGIIGLAFSVNVIEFACSIGIPQAFTKILDINALSWIVRQFYMALYILMYMVDDVFVFGIAIYSFEKIGLTSKYSRWSHLLGGILMLILGAILVFKPDLLAF
jgi:uncharacterized protein (UPF0333 family)